MALYILRRLLLMVPTMFGITLLVFCVMQLAPGDPATLATAGDISSGGAATSGEGDVQSTYEKFRERFRLDEPLHVQYFVWVGNLLTFDFGVEFHDPSQSVGEELLRRLRITVPLALTPQAAQQRPIEQAIPPQAVEKSTQKEAAQAAVAMAVESRPLSALRSVGSDRGWRVHQASWARVARASTRRRSARSRYWSARAS